MPTATTLYACRHPYCGLRFRSHDAAVSHVETVHLPADGRIALSTAKSNGARVGLYDGVAAGMDTDGGRWQTVCEEHGHIISHRTLALARSFMPDVAEWCETCAYTACGWCGELGNRAAGPVVESGEATPSEPMHAACRKSSTNGALATALATPAERADGYVLPMHRHGDHLHVGGPRDADPARIGHTHSIPGYVPPVRR